MGLREMLQHYAGPAVAVSDNGRDRFNEISRQTADRYWRDGIAAALHSTNGALFGQIIAIFFEQSNPDQKAALLNEIVLSIGPAAATTAAGGVLGRLLRAGPMTPVSPAVAIQLSATDLSALVSTARRRDDSFVDRLATFYARQRVFQ